jgi:hypothetical protein
MDKEIQQILIDGALDTAEHFINWARENVPDLKKDLVSEGNTLQADDVKNLFDALSDDKKKSYQYLIDNEHNIIAARRLGLLQHSESMPSGKPGHRLLDALELLKKESVEINNPTVIPFDFTTPVPTDWTPPKGGTDMSAVLNEVLKNDALKNLDKIRSVVYFTDGEVDNKAKPKK